MHLFDPPILKVFVWFVLKVHLHSSSIINSFHTAVLLNPPLPLVVQPLLFSIFISNLQN